MKIGTQGVAIYSLFYQECWLRLAPNSKLNFFSITDFPRPSSTSKHLAVCMSNCNACTIAVSDTFNDVDPL